ncbi:MAG: hypothetical protein QOF87_3090 [Pseudonocardiales bacterium]|jgi:hypothetical protein|nr:hypothetical protein [Pseudonocardiales bacterium]MDT4963443.1 hypothetical protein [Pseudonocardiales bacterium]
MTTSRSMGTRGIALVLIGALALLISFTVLEWYPGSSQPSAVAHIRFADLHQASDFDLAPVLSGAYFGWLAWVLLLLVIAVGFAANVPTQASGVLRILGAAIGLGGVVATYYALAGLSRRNEGDYPLHNASAGIWLALAGFLIAGLGAALGPMRAR